MPIYEYECSQCGRVIEKFTTRVATNEDHLIEDHCICEDVGMVHYKKVISTPHFKIKGYSEKNGYSDYQVQDNTPVASVTEPE